MQVSRGTVLGLIVAIAAGGAVLWLWPREEPGVRAAVERRVVELGAAADRRDLGELLDGASERFRSQEGWDKQALEGVLLSRVLRGDWVRVFFVDLHVDERTPREAAFRVRLIFARSEAKELAQLSRESVFGAYAIEGTFAREDDGTWRVTRARHRTLGPGELF